MIDPIYVCTVVVDETQSPANSVGGRCSLEYGPNKTSLLQQSTPKRERHRTGGFQFSQSNLNYEYQFSAESV